MSMDRKTFLKIGSCALAGMAARGASTGRQMAMVVDTSKCLREEGCDRCIRACHQAHNVPEIADPAREVKWIWKEPFEAAFPSMEGEHLQESLKEREVLVLCNHCANPPCVRVCPTGATWKRESDGIVMMDWHRCIGCRYCVAACPYGSRSFNWSDPREQLVQINDQFPTRTKGVVEKCTFCEERLAKGQLPACVEACEENALVFGDIDSPEISELLRENFTLRRKPELGTEPQIFYIL